MSVQFSLRSKETGEYAILQEVDNDLATAFGCEPDPRLWFEGWYNSLGFLWACYGEGPKLLLKLVDWCDLTEFDDCLDAESRQLQRQQLTLLLRIRRWILDRYEVC